MEIIICIIIGAVAASVGWFFVWRNNKKKFEDALASADNKIKA
jgi:Tfp pilus assembly protein PilO